MRKLHRILTVLSLTCIGAFLITACSSQAPSTVAPAAPATTVPVTSSTASVGTAGTGQTPATLAAPAAQPTAGGTLTIGLDQEPPTLDPGGSPSAITFYITASAAESLLFLTSDHQLKPWLADSYIASADGKQFTFKLRHDVKFQDGTPFNAQAVKWNFDRIVDPKFKAGASLATLAGYDNTAVVDDFTATVSFKGAYAPFLTYAACPFLAMVSPTATQQQGDAVNQKPVLTGPFKFDEYVAKDHATMSKWADYNRQSPVSDHNGPAYLDKVIWKFIPEASTRTTTLQSGETQMIDIVNSTPDLAKLKSSSDFVVSAKPWVGASRQLLINVTKAPTDDVKVRQAISYATDKDTIVNTLYSGLGQKSFAPITAVTLDDPSLHSYYAYDQAKAKQLLDDDGWKAGSDGIRTKNGQRLEFVINTIDYGGGADPFAELFQGQMRQVGMDVKIKSQARPPYYDDNYKCTTNGSTIFLRYGDPDALYSLFASANYGANFNTSCLKDPSVDAALAQGRSEVDPAKRKAIYVDLEKKLLDMAVTVPIADDISVFVSKSNVTGLKFDNFSYPFVGDVSIKK